MEFFYLFNVRTLLINFNLRKQDTMEELIKMLGSLWRNTIEIGGVKALISSG